MERERGAAYLEREQARDSIKDDSLNHTEDPISHKSANNQACNS